MTMTHMCLCPETHVNKHVDRHVEKVGLLLERVEGGWQATMATGSKMKVLVLR